MTVTYTAQVASCKRFGCFWKLLFRWKGSIYKLLWPNLTVYVMMYSTLSVCYRFLLDEDQKTTFEKFSLHCQTYGELIPVSFVLGFYISIVVKRWWDQYLSIPWPDPLAVLVSAFLCGQDERSRLMRRTIMRYANLSLVITLRMMCPTVKKRFPTMDHMVEAGFMLRNEKKIFDKLEEKTSHPKYWLPLVWSIHILNTARREERIRDDFGLSTLINAINTFRAGCGSLLNYDWISIPLVYSQVVTLAVYTYFLATLMGNQYLNPKKGYTNHTIDLIFPIFTLLQFFFYMGWLLVAETLVNPFGEDDDDFEVNWLIDRNLQVSYLIVDEVHEDYPELVKDQYWEEVVPSKLPYTEAAKQFFTEPFLGSTRDVDVPLDQRGFVLMSMLNEPDILQKGVSMKERKETMPVQIASVLTPIDSCTSTPGVNRKTSNSVINLLRKNIYGNSKRSISSSDVLNTRRKSMAISCTSGTPGYSVASTFKRNFNDFPEDIFWMSDFSLAEPKKFLKCDKCPQLENEQDTLMNTFPSERISKHKPQSVKSQHMQTQEMRQAASWHGLEFSQGQGQGEQLIPSTGLQLNHAIDLESSLRISSEQDVMALEINTPLINSEINLSDLPENYLQSKHKETSEKEIVQLDEQILLEQNSFEVNQDLKNLSTIEESASQTEQEGMTEDKKFGRFQVFERKDDSNLSNIISPNRTQAIFLPGSIMLKDHHILPVIQQEQNNCETVETNQTDQNILISQVCPSEEKTDQSTLHGTT